MPAHRTSLHNFLSFKSLSLVILINVPESNAMEDSVCMYCGAKTSMLNVRGISVKKTISPVIELAYSVI